MLQPVQYCINHDSEKNDCVRLKKMSECSVNVITKPSMQCVALRHARSHHDSSSSSSPPNRTALRSGTDPPAAATTNALPRSFPRNLANNPPDPPEARVGVSGGTLDATVDALAVSGVTLELVVVVVVVGFLSAERVGGGKRRDGRVRVRVPVGGRGGECDTERDCERECECDVGRGGELGEDVLRWRRGAVVGGYSGARWAGRWGVRERWRPIAICW